MDSASTATAGSAAMASDKPLPKDLSHYYSVTTANRQPSAMKQYYRYFQIPGIGNLAGGKSYTVTLGMERRRHGRTHKITATNGGLVGSCPARHAQTPC